MKICWDNLETFCVAKRKNAKIDFIDRSNGRKYYVMKCTYCGDDCLVSTSNFKQNKDNFCNLSCANKAKNHPKGKDHPSYGIRRPDVSKRMRENNPTKSGAENPNWKGGISKREISNRYKEWRRSIFGRDDSTCQLCGIRDSLEVHHIKKYSEYPELRFDICNGITFCKECHSSMKGKEELFEEKCFQIISKYFI